jgi:hypothetical protein
VGAIIVTGLIHMARFGPGPALDFPQALWVFLRDLCWVSAGQC